MARDAIDLGESTKFNMDDEWYNKFCNQVERDDKRSERVVFSTDWQRFLWAFILGIFVGKRTPIQNKTKNPPFGAEVFKNRGKILKLMIGLALQEMYKREPQKLKADYEKAAAHIAALPSESAFRAGFEKKGTGKSTKEFCGAEREDPHRSIERQRAGKPKQRLRASEQRRGWRIAKSTNGIYCDNSPVRYSPMGNGVRFVQTVTEPVQMEAIIDVSFTDEGELVVEHSIYNKSREGLKLSIYTETPFCSDGFVFIPQGRAASPERPGKIMTLWEDCKWSDERLFIGDEFVTVKATDLQDRPRLKIGLNDTIGVVGFIGRKFSLLKHYTHNSSALYPFYNCSAFATENNGYLSIQMTSPFYLVEPEEAARHIEKWSILPESRDISPDDEENIRSVIGE